MELSEVRDQGGAILDEVERTIVGKRDALELIVIGALADGHILLEDYPGLAKTLIARSLAQATSLEFSRIQFTPDLMPSDVTGSSVFDQRTTEFTFIPGPIFTNLLLAAAIEGYIVDLVAATRASKRLAVGASPRGSLALLKLSRAKAALDGRDFVVPEDVKAVAVPALAHRLMLRPELWVQRVRSEDVVAEALESVPTPPAEDALRAAG